MRALAIAAAVILSASALVAATANERLADAATSFSAIMRAPDKGIPQDLLAKAQCVVIIPGVKKGAFIVGGEYGRGFAECRRPGGVGWGAPAAVQLEGGSVGFQLGGSETDVVLLVMSRDGMNKLMQDKFTIGADASVAAGPVGRTASAATDAQMHAEILSWSRSKGIFAGVSLNGAAIHPDRDSNQQLYGRKLDTREVLENSRLRPPAEARPLVHELDRYSSMSNSAERR